jgi:hypothetical protein
VATEKQQNERAARLTGEELRTLIFAFIHHQYTKCLGPTDDRYAEWGHLGRRAKAAYNELAAHLTFHEEPAPPTRNERKPNL